MKFTCRTKFSTTMHTSVSQRSADHRDTYGFEGFTVSDCGGVPAINTGHYMFGTPEEATAHALHGGLDVECGMNPPNSVGYYYQVYTNNALLHCATFPALFWAGSNLGQCHVLFLTCLPAQWGVGGRSHRAATCAGCDRPSAAMVAPVMVTPDRR